MRIGTTIRMRIGMRMSTRIGYTLQTSMAKKVFSDTGDVVKPNEQSKIDEFTLRRLRDEITIVLRASFGYDDPANQELLMMSKKCRCLSFITFEQQKLSTKHRVAVMPVRSMQNQPFRTSE